MASLTKRKNGSRFITFIDGQGRPQTITLGKGTGDEKRDNRYALTFKGHVEDLLSAMLYHHAPPAAAVQWLDARDDRTYDKFVRVGLAQPRVRMTLKDWLEQFVADRKGDLKHESIRKLEQTKAKLLAHFNAGIDLRRITVQDAADWRQSLKNSGLSDASVKTHSGNAKTMIGEAVRRKLIEDNPFAFLKSGATPSKYSRYVTPDEISRIIDACPNAEWRLLFGLARYAGLRIPSESHLLTWSDVDFENARLTVHSPKTEHHDGHDQRIVPIMPKLMELLQDRFDEADEGQECLVTISGKGAVIRRVRSIWKRAGVEPWKRLWQTLRQSCEKEWAMTIPQYAVSKFIGHSITISGRHYANDVPRELFDRIVNAGDGDAEKAQRKAQQNTPEPTGIERNRTTAADDDDGRSSSSFKDFQPNSISPCQTRRWSRGESNPRPVVVNMPLLHA